MKYLENEEIATILGGISNANPQTGDIDNKNTVASCYCTYDNSSATTNTNTVDSCNCICSLKQSLR